MNIDRKPILYRSFDRYLRPDERKGATPGKFKHYSEEALVIIIGGRRFSTSKFAPGKGRKFCLDNFGMKPKEVIIDNIDYGDLYK